MSFSEGFVAELQGKAKYVEYIGDVTEEHILIGKNGPEVMSIASKSAYEILFLYLCVVHI